MSKKIGQSIDSEQHGVKMTLEPVNENAARHRTFVADSNYISDLKSRERPPRRRLMVGNSFIILFMMLVISGAAPTGRAQVQPAEQKGLPANSNFAAADVDTVNLQNGNLHIEIPIFVDKQRAGKTLRWELIYDSRTWLKKFNPATCGRPPCTPVGSYGNILLDNITTAGWRLSGPQNWTIGSTHQDLTCDTTNEPLSQVTNWSVTDPQGTQHLLPITQELGTPCNGQTLIGPALDGSGIVYDSTSNIIYLKDGTQISSSAIRDSNGNLYTFADNRDANGRVPVTTTVGSNIQYTSPLGVALSGPSYTKYTVRDSGGNPTVYTVNYQAVDFKSNFCNVPASSGLTCNESSGVLLLISSITLPDNRAYSFTYNNNSAGEIATMTLPTGAVISYGYGLYYNPIFNSNRFYPPNYVGGPAISSRTISVDGSTQPWTYNVGLGAESTVTDPYGNVTIHDFNNIQAPGYSNFETPEVYETLTTYKDSSGAVLRTVATQYTAEFSNVFSIPVNVRPTSVTTTLDNGQVTQTQTDYETFSFPDNYGNEVATRKNPSEIRVYDYGSGAPGNLIEKTDYTYLHNDVPAYATLNIVDRPSTVTISDGSGNVAALTSYEYDNYSHAGQTFSPSGATQHDSS